MYTPRVPSRSALWYSVLNTIVDFIVPGSPHTRTIEPWGIPPDSLSSNPWMNVRTRSPLVMWTREPLGARDIMMATRLSGRGLDAALTQQGTEKERGSERNGDAAPHSGPR